MNVPNPPKRRLLQITVALVAIACYANAFRTPFVLDDQVSTIDDPRIHGLSRAIKENFQLPETAVTGRPVVAMTFALNYAISGREPFGYHIVNIVLHILCTLLVGAIAESALRSPAVPEYLRERSIGLAYSLALIFAAHPIQTEAVTYIVQRTELMWSLFFLLTLYCSLRAWHERLAIWSPLAGAACLLGVGCKENMVVAPVLVLLYDWAFISQSIREALRRHLRHHVMLFASWILLVWIVSQGARRGSAGFGLGVTPLDYLRTQMCVIPGYVKLVFWPSDLVAAHFLTPVKSWSQCWWEAFLVLGMIVAAVIIFIRNCPAGFPALWTIIILAPTSSFVPIATEMAADRRMYLPMLGVVWYAIWGVFTLSRRVGVNGLREKWIRYARAAAVGATVLALGVLTYRRNRDYRSEAAIWADIAAKQPESVAAAFGYGKALVDSGEIDAGAAQYERALKLSPGHYMTLLHYGQAMNKAQQIPRAVMLLRESVQAKPDFAESNYWLGRMLARTHNNVEAVSYLNEAIRLKPDYAEAYVDLAILQSINGRDDEAIGALETAKKIAPENADARFNLGVLYAKRGRLADARVELEAAALLDPDDSDPQFRLAEIYRQMGDAERARQLENEGYLRLKLRKPD